MNIIDLISKKIMNELLGENQVEQKIKQNELIEIGKPYIFRGRDSGVNVGKIVYYNGTHIKIEIARKLWFFKCSKSIALSGVATYGVDAGESRITAPIKGLIILISDISEIIPFENEEIFNEIMSQKITEQR